MSKRADEAPPSGRRRARARPGEGRYTENTGFWTDVEMVARIDAIAAARNLTRSEAVRLLIGTGLPVAEEEAVRARRKRIKLVKGPDAGSQS